MNNRDFTAEYIFHEYPKWVTLADGSKIIVNNEDEEQIVVGDQDVSQDDERAALFAQAKELGLKVHGATSTEKLREKIAEAMG